MYMQTRKRLLKTNPAGGSVQYLLSCLNKVMKRKYYNSHFEGFLVVYVFLLLSIVPA